MAQNNHNTSLVLGLILAGIVSRLAPHPLNMALVTGATLYGASTLSRTSSVIIPLSIMFVTDLVLGFHSTMLFTWGGFALIALLAHHTLNGKTNFVSVASTTLASSVIFFFVSNFGVFVSGNMYTLDLAGLSTCFINALPFFQNTLLGDAVYTSAIFGIGYLSNLSIFHLKSSATL